AELILGGVVLELGAPQPVLDEGDRGGTMTQAEVREGRGRGRHIERGNLVAAQRETDSVVAVWFVEARDAQASGGVQDRGDADRQLGLDGRDVERVAHRGFEGGVAVR